MAEANRNGITNVKEDIREMRKALDLASSSFKSIYSAKNFRFFFLFAGIWAAVFSIIYEILERIFNPVPSRVMFIYFVFLGAGWMALLIIRTVISLKAARKRNLKVNILKLIKELLSTRLWLAVIPVLVLIVLIPVRFAGAWRQTDYLPYTGMAVGLILNIIGVIIRERAYSAAGFWMILSGLLCFLIITMPVHFAFGIVFTPGCFLFFFMAPHSEKGKKHNGT